MLSLIRKELPYPFFYNMPHIASCLKSHTPKLELVKAALINGGFKVSECHFKTSSLKTDAPCAFVLDIFRKFVISGPGKESFGNISSKPEQVRNFFSRECIHSIDFSIKDKEMLLREESAFFPNPQPNWGPKSRAGKRKREEKKEKDV